MIRPILFIPVILYCILGGLFFGIVAGSIYSIIGLTLSSIIVYFFLHRTPKTFHHILSIKDKVLGRDTNFSKSQITWLRLIPLDRKSTRLNSSHVAISYAVFCLKKK